MRDVGPFSGEPGENVNHFVKQCKYAWLGISGLTDEEKTEVQVMTMINNLKGPALDFVHSLPGSVQDDFTELSARLIEQFPFERKVEDRLEVLSKMCHQKQGQQSLEDYVKSVRVLSAQIGKDYQAELARAWVIGLNDQAISAAVRAVMISWDPITVTAAITAVRQIEGSGFNNKAAEHPRHRG